MEIITPGKLPSEDVFEAECRHCKCRVRFNRGEAQYHSWPKNEQSLSVLCPTPNCKHRIFVDI